jgi:hypothetical protein
MGSIQCGVMNLFFITPGSAIDVRDERVENVKDAPHFQYTCAYKFNSH